MTTQFTAMRVTETDWIIQDTRFPIDDSRHVVAYVEATEHLFRVTWVLPLPLPTEYLRVEDVLDDLARRQEAAATGGSTRPVPIPHLPPAH